jgi:peptidoglycan/LPS O-acetylase OafA/YrhL
MRQTILWIGIILAVTAIDLGVRFGMSFEIMRVIRIEAVLFLLTSVVLFALYRSNPRTIGRRRTIQIVLVASFALAGIRAAIWAAGQPVFWANLAILILAGVIIGVFTIRRRAQCQRRTSGQGP